MNKERDHWAKNRKIKRHEEKRYNFLKVVFLSFFMMFVFVLAHLFFSSRFLKIENVEISGLIGLDENDVYNKADEYLSGRDGFVFSRNRFFFLRRNELGVFLVNNFNKIKSVSVQKVFPDSIKIEIVERNLLFLWCVEENNCYLVDEDGVVYGKSNLSLADMRQDDLVKILDKSKKDVRVGEKVLDSDYVGFVSKIRDKLWNDLGISVLEEYETSSRIANEIIVTTADGWKIYFDDRDSVDSLIGILDVFLKKEVGLGNISDLEYVDLRVKEKVFYKMRGKEGVGA